MNFSAMVPRNLSAPPEVDLLMNGIRTAPAIARDFPDVKLSSLRIAKAMDRNAAVLADPATFTVICNPKGKDASAKPGNGPKPAAGGGGGGAVAQAH
jgi:hypothetical protein